MPGAAARTTAALLLALSLAAGFAPAAAAGLIPTYIVPCGIQSPEAPAEYRQPCTLCHMGVAVMNITNFAIYAVALPLVALLIAVSGVIMITAAGSEERVTTGKRILWNAVIGAVIVFVAWLAVDTTIKVLTVRKDFLAPGFGPWYQIDPKYLTDKGCPL